MQINFKMIPVAALVLSGLSDSAFALSDQILKRCTFPTSVRLMEKPSGLAAQQLPDTCSPSSEYGLRSCWDERWSSPEDGALYTGKWATFDQSGRLIKFHLKQQFVSDDKTVVDTLLKKFGQPDRTVALSGMTAYIFGDIQVLRATAQNQNLPDMYSDQRIDGTVGCLFAVESLRDSFSRHSDDRRAILHFMSVVPEVWKETFVQAQSRSSKKTIKDLERLTGTGSR